MAWRLLARRCRWMLMHTFCSAVQNKLPVVIVGAGPVGLTLAIMLRKLDVPIVVVERRVKFSQHPQAHFINNRTMEIFRALDGIGEEIEALQPPLDHWRKFIYCISLSGPMLGAVNHISDEDLSHSRSPTSVAHFSQSHLLPLLVKKASDAGLSITDASILLNNDVIKAGQILLGCECTSIHAMPDNVTVDICSNHVKEHVVGSYLVATDGAGSGIRKAMGIKMEGEEDMQKLVSVHFISRELGKYLVEHRPGMLFFVFNEHVITVIVAHDLRSGEFVAQIPFYPPQQGLGDFTVEACRSIICKAAGMENIDIDIKAVKSWTMHAQVAQKFISSDGRVILAGDAAHRFPPAGGFGMNTGIQDVHNLAWKLAAVTKGIAPPSLLMTYNEERHLIAVTNTQLSVVNYKAAMRVPSALGLDPSYARSVHQAVNSGFASMLPNKIQAAIVNGAFAFGRSQLSSAFFNDYNPIAFSRMKRLQRILQEGSSLQLQFPAEDLGFRYIKGALVPDEVSTQYSNEDKPTGRRREYVPSCEPGMRLPHIKIRRLNTENMDMVISSTLDLINPCRLQFLLIVGNNKSGLLWAEAGLRASEANSDLLKIAIIRSDKNLKHSHSAGSISDEDGSQMEEWRSRNMGQFTDIVGMDSSLWKLIPEFGSILVRPDGHIAWRSQVEYSASSLSQMHQAFLLILRKKND